MRPHRSLIIIFAIGTVLIGGCGPEKEIPTEVTLSTERMDRDGPTAPSKSDENAKAYIDQCIAAATDGHPERLQKVRSNRSTVAGLWRNQSGELIPTTRHIQAIWPDQFLVSLEFGAGPVKSVTIGQRRPLIWKRHSMRDGQEGELPSSKEDSDILSVDAIGQHWLPLLFPLTQENVVVFDLKPESIMGRDAMTVKAGVPDCPVFTLWFNPTTRLLSLVTYTHYEVGSRFQKRVTLDGHRMHDGVMVPMKIEVARNGEPVEEWAVASWEFPEKLDESVFDNPAEKQP
jgi:hypothetical protein